MGIFYTQLSPAAITAPKDFVENCINLYFFPVEKYFSVLYNKMYTIS